MRDRVIQHKVLLASVWAFTSFNPTVAAVAPAPYLVPPFQSFNYTHLYASSNGTTHTAECSVEALPLSAFVSGQTSLQAESYSATLAAANKTLFNQMPVNEVVRYDILSYENLFNHQQKLEPDAFQV